MLRDYWSLPNAALAISWLLVASACVWFSVKKDVERRTAWCVLAVFQALMAAEIFLRLRFQLSQFLSARVKEAQVYESRRPYQSIGIVVLLVLIVPLCAGLIVSSRRLTRPLKLASLGTLVGWGGTLLEAISLHGIDAYSRLFYTPSRPLGLLLCAYGCYLACCRDGFATTRAGVTVTTASRSGRR